MYMFDLVVNRSLNLLYTIFIRLGLVMFIFMLQKQPPEVFCKKSVLKNFANFTGKDMCWNLFLIKTETETQMFSLEYCIIFKNTFF